jgi:hypothetical protein
MDASASIEKRPAPHLAIQAVHRVHKAILFRCIALVE